MSRPVRNSARLSKTQNISYIILRCQETFNHVQVGSRPPWRCQRPPFNLSRLWPGFKIKITATMSLDNLIADNCLLSPPTDIPSQEWMVCSAVYGTWIWMFTFKASLIPRTGEWRNIYSAQHFFLHGGMHLQNLAATTTAWSFEIIHKVRLPQRLLAKAYRISNILALDVSSKMEWERRSEIMFASWTIYSVPCYEIGSLAGLT